MMYYESKIRMMIIYRVYYRINCRIFPLTSWHLVDSEAFQTAGASGGKKSQKGPLLHYHSHTTWPGKRLHSYGKNIGKWWFSGRLMGFYRIYPLVMTNIATWKDPPCSTGKLTVSAGPFSFKTIGLGSGHSDFRGLIRQGAPSIYTKIEPPLGHTNEYQPIWVWKRRGAV